MTERPYELSAYIREQQNITERANYGDHKPTYQIELNMIATRADILYESGKKVIESISADDLRRCRSLYVWRSEYGADNLCTVVIGGVEVIVPAYFALIEEVRALLKILE